MSTLAILSNKRIFDVELSKDKQTVTITEGCDNYFDCKLSRSQLQELITELAEILRQMTP